MTLTTKLRALATALPLLLATLTSLPTTQASASVCSSTFDSNTNLMQFYLAFQLNTGMAVNYTLGASTTTDFLLRSQCTCSIADGGGQIVNRYQYWSSRLCKLFLITEYTNSVGELTKQCTEADDDGDYFCYNMEVFTADKYGMDGSEKSVPVHEAIDLDGTYAAWCPYLCADATSGGSTVKGYRDQLFVDLPQL